MIKEDIQNDYVAIHEFYRELEILTHVNHPNIIKVKGAGKNPRRFIVLEYLGGGSLQTMLSQNQFKLGIANIIFRRSTFTYLNLLIKSRDMADALNYLHEGVFEGVTVIHRDLKVNPFSIIYDFYIPDIQLHIILISLIMLDSPLMDLSSFLILA